MCGERKRRFGRIEAGRRWEPGDRNATPLVQSREEKLCCFLRSTNVQPEAEDIDIFQGIDIRETGRSRGLHTSPGRLHEPGSMQNYASLARAPRVFDAELGRALPTPWPWHAPSTASRRTPAASVIVATVLTPYSRHIVDVIDAAEQFAIVIGGNKKREGGVGSAGGDVRQHCIVRGPIFRRGHAGQGGIGRHQQFAQRRKILWPCLADTSSPMPMNS